MTTDIKPAASPSKPRPIRRGLNISVAQIMLILGVVFGLSVIINFSSRIQTEQRISAQANQLRGEVTALAATQSAQATELAFVSSDAFVGQWAHNDGHMALSGEVLVVPIPSSDVTPTPVPQTAPLPEPINNFQIWWDLFFSTGS